MAFNARLLSCSVKCFSVFRQYHGINSNMILPSYKYRHNLQMVKRFNQNNKAVKCWQCGIERKNIADLFCDNCEFIQSPSDTNNYFKVFELEENYNVDLGQLQQKYRKMQSLLHPDKFSNRSDEEKRISDEFSSLVNKAYDVIQMPLKRAVHLLNLKGATIQEGQRIEDPNFLMEIMELNEEVEDADTPAKLIKLNEKNKKELNNITKCISEAFGRNDIAKAKEYIIKMKYYSSVSNHINSLMREKGIVE